MTGVHQSWNEAKMSPKPEAESPEQHHVVQGLRASPGIVPGCSSPMPVPWLEQGVPAGPFLEMWPHLSQPTGFLSPWEELRGPASPLKGPGRGRQAGTWLGWLQQGRRGALTRARPRTQHPMLASFMCAQAAFLGLFSSLISSPRSTTTFLR